MGCYVRGDKNGMGCYVRGDKNSVGCFVGVGKSSWDVLSGMFCPGMFCPAPHYCYAIEGEENLSPFLTVPMEK